MRSLWVEGPIHVLGHLGVRYPLQRIYCDQNGTLTVTGAAATPDPGGAGAAEGAPVGLFNGAIVSII